MATQRLIAATVAGAAADAVASLFRSWRDHPPGADAAKVDHFCLQLRDNGASLSVVYFCEWMDRWSMGDAAPAPGAIIGKRFQAACLTPREAAAWANQCGNQFPEQTWSAARLREAADAGAAIAQRRVVMVVREVLGTSTTDDETRAALGMMPEWLTGV
jgi:hypothetical protein